MKEVIIMKLSKYLKKCDSIYHTTLDPQTSGVVRIHLVPPKKLKPGIPWVAVINGYSVLPLQSSWAVLLKEFMETLNETKGKILSNDEIKTLVEETVKKLKLIFTNTEASVLKKDLNDIVATLKQIAKGQEPDLKIGYTTLAQYSKYMKAPHRMDLMISSMEKNGCWNCNQKCLHCYASGEIKSNVEELGLEDWKKIIDGCKEAGIPSITFTGGEPTIRKDLVEMVSYAKWFVTRLNTNGILLTKELCEQLYDASLDSVQVTLYSYNEETHNSLVGGNHFNNTIEGIKNALAAGLDVSVNTPLCSINSDYIETIKFCQSLGVKYFSCSGLIPSGNAKQVLSKITSLSKDEIYKIVKMAVNYAKEQELDVAFTSPGWIDKEKLKKLKLVVPSCGACLSNMAVAPNGDVIPCQSWLSGLTLGNMLETNFKKIWRGTDCVRIRKDSAKEECICPLKAGDN